MRRALDVTRTLDARRTATDVRHVHRGARAIHLHPRARAKRHRARATAVTPRVNAAAQTLEGVVVAVSGNKSKTLRVDRKVPHPKYIKRVNASKKFMFHDEQGACKVGDRVEIVACRHDEPRETIHAAARRHRVHRGRELRRRVSARWQRKARRRYFFASSGVIARRRGRDGGDGRSNGRTMGARGGDGEKTLFGGFAAARRRDRVRKHSHSTREFVRYYSSGFFILSRRGRSCVASRRVASHRVVTVGAGRAASATKIG